MRKALATMTAAVVSAPRSAPLVEIPLREPSAGEVLVRIEGCGVCGSSLPVWEGRSWFDYPLDPGAPGHEAWGEVMGVGDGVSSLEPGHRVAILSQRGFAEFDFAEERLAVRLPAELDGEPVPGEALGCAVNVVRRARLRPGQSVAVVGMGFLGSVVAQLSVLAGAEVHAVRRDTKVDGPFSCVIEAAGTQSALDTASRLVAEGGLLVIAGFHQDGPRTIDLQSWNWRGLDVVNAHERDPLRLAHAVREAVRLLVDGSLDPSRLYTHVFPLSRLDEALDAAMTRPTGFVKALVCP